MDNQWVQKIETELSEIKTRLALAERDISSIMSTLNKIDSNTTWIVRLLFGGLVASVITFIVKGGLNI